MGQWKGFRKKGKPWELYDLSKDPEELHSVASDHPEVLTQIKAAATEAHEPVRGGEIFDKSFTEKDRLQGARKKTVNPSK